MYFKSQASTLLISILCVINEATIKIWLDNDISVDPDDSLAVLEALALNNDLIEIVGMSVVGGDPVFGACWLKRTLFSFGFFDIPIYIGYDSPMQKVEGTYEFAGASPGYTTLTDAEKECWVEQKPHFKHFPPPPGLWSRADVVVAVGPVTNIAYLLSSPNRAEYRIKHFVSMGGAIFDQPYPDFDYYMHRIWDYNLRIDPYATMLVLSSPLIDEISLVTGNITLNCFMTEANLDSMKQIQDSRLIYPSLINAIEIWKEYIPSWNATFHVPWIEGIVEYMHDPLTLSYVVQDALQSQFVTMERLPLGLFISPTELFQAVDLNVYDGDRTIFEHIRTISVSTASDCAHFLEWYFPLINEYEFENTPRECGDDDQSSSSSSRSHRLRTHGNN